MSSTCRYCRPNPGGDDTGPDSQNRDSWLPAMIGMFAVLAAPLALGIGIVAHWSWFLVSAGLLVLGLALIDGAVRSNRRRS